MIQRILAAGCAMALALGLLMGAAYVVPVGSGGGAGVSDGDKGDVAISGSGSVYDVQSHSGTLLGVGNYTNRSASIYVEDPASPGVPNLWLYGSDAGPALTTYKGNLSFGFVGRLLIMESNANRISWGNMPYGSIGLGANYGINQIAGSNVLSEVVVAVNAIHFPLSSNHLAQAIDTGLGANTIAATNLFWRTHVLSNITVAFNGSFVPRSNIVYGLWIANATSTITFDPLWRWIDGSSISDAPACTDGTYLIRVVKNAEGTNAWVEAGKSLRGGGGGTFAGVTNSAIYSAAAGITTTNIDWAVRDIHTNTLAIGTTDVAYLFTNAAAGRTIILNVINRTNDVTCSWPATISWAEGSAPTIIGSNSLSRFIFFTDDGKTNGQVLQNTANRRFGAATNDFVSGVVYTNNLFSATMVSASISLTNILSTDKAQMNLWVDQSGDGTFELVNRYVRCQGVALLSTSELLFDQVQPGGRFCFTNQSGGTASAAIDTGSSRWNTR
jgi:hypothetical protein